MGVSFTRNSRAKPLLLTRGVLLRVAFAQLLDTYTVLHACAGVRLHGYAVLAGEGVRPRDCPSMCFPQRSANPAAQRLPVRMHTPVACAMSP